MLCSTFSSQVHLASVLYFHIHAHLLCLSLKRIWRLRLPKLMTAFLFSPSLFGQNYVTRSWIILQEMNTLHNWNSTLISLFEVRTKQIPSSELILILISGLKPLFLISLLLLLFVKDSNLIIPLTYISPFFFLHISPIPLGCLSRTHPEVGSL